MAEAAQPFPPDVAIQAQPEPYRLTEKEKTAIIAERLSGVPVAAIAAKYGCERTTVWRICNQAQQTQKAVTRDWRENQVKLAVSAVNAGLKCPDDPYKRGNLGATVLKGLGVYAQDNSVNVNVANWLGSRPPGCDEIEALTVESSTPMGSESESLHNTSTETDGLQVVVEPPRE